MPINNSLTRADAPEIASWGMASAESEVLTVGASGTKYTAPANGFYYVECALPSANYIGFKSTKTKIILRYSRPANTSDVSVLFPITKGDEATLLYTGSGSGISLLKFFYAVGEVS